MYTPGSVALPVSVAGAMLIADHGTTLPVTGVYTFLFLQLALLFVGLGLLCIRARKIQSLKHQQ